MDRIQTAGQIVEICRRLHQRNLIAAADGNVSVRLPSGNLLITPTGKNKGFITSNDLAEITPEGTTVSGEPSGESLMHLEVYRRCPQATAIVHAHPPTAIAFSVARPDLTELPNDGLSEIILAVGRIPIAPYARPGTQTMGEVLGPFLPQSRVLILARHGGLSWGESLEEAYNGMERLEHAALILKSAIQLGGLSSLPPKELYALHRLRRELGERTR